MRPVHAIGLCLVVLVGAVGVTSAGAQSGNEEQQIRDLQAQRDAARAQRAANAAGLNGLRADDAQIQQALDAIDAELASQNAQLADAQRAQAAAQADVDAADAAVARAEAELAGIRSDLAQQVVDAYVNVPSATRWSVFNADDALDASTKDRMIEVAATANLDSVDRYRAIQEDLAIARRDADDARARADERRRDVDAKLDRLQTAQVQQQQLAAQVAERIASSQAEADALSAIDTQLSAQLTSAQSALAARLAAQQRAAEAARASLSGAGRRIETANIDDGGDGPPGAPSLATVGGITVAASIAGQLQAMLQAAAADGITLSGSGYRNMNRQIELRRQHCGSSDYAVYQAPPGSCSPPTARPGSSMHERGLAIDFRDGSGSMTRRSAGFAWLSANASQYGFYNLPSEPWHWSTTGN